MSGGLWPILAPLPCPAHSPCTTAWGTRGPWARPRSALPAAAASAAQTTAPRGDVEEGRGWAVAATLCQPTHPHTPPPRGPVPPSPSTLGQRAQICLRVCVGFLPCPPHGDCLQSCSWSGMYGLLVLGPSWCGVGPGALCLVGLLFGVPRACLSGPHEPALQQPQLCPHPGPFHRPLCLPQAALP